MRANLNFVRLQGFRDTTAASCDYRFPALMWQPRVIGVIVLLGLLFETGWYFIVLGTILWWNVLVPRLNPFDAIYHALFLKRKGVAPLGPAPAPRRFSQGMAGTFALGIGVSMLRGQIALAWTLTILLLIALTLLIVGRFCVGSYLFHVFTGQLAAANKMLPWSRGDEASTKP